MSNFTLNEEVICDHLVTADVKKLWAAEMDLAQQLRKICEKHNIRYYAAGGTLLGAVRHKGFIPWDNDMDFLMPYDEYERFCEIAPKELSDPYVFQKTFSHSRIRNNRTTAVTQKELETAVPPYDLGIFIDIFPMFAVPKNDLKRRLHYVELKLMRAARSGQKIDRLNKMYDRKSFKNVMNPKVLAWHLYNGIFKDDEMVEKHMELCNKFSKDKDADSMGITSFLPYNDRYIWKNKCFDEVTEMEFENITVPGIKNYDLYLRTSYGDYTKFVKDGAQHEMPIFDTERPASYYVERFKRQNAE